MTGRVYDRDKDLNSEFWSDLGSPNVIWQSELNVTGILRILKVLGLLLLPKKDKKFIYK